MPESAAGAQSPASLDASLERVYGPAANRQYRRYREALAQFAMNYGPGNAVVYRAPGRVNFIGEHTDYNQGFVFPLALDRDTLLIARPRADALVNLANVEPAYHPMTFAIGEQVRPARRGDWGNYVRGPAQLLAQRLAPQAVCGFDGLVVGEQPYGVPRGAGLSSSSSLTVVAAVALADLNGWTPDGQTLAHFCAEAEWYVGTRGGIMDHFVAILAQRGYGMFLDCRPTPAGHYRTHHRPIPTGYRVMVLNSGVRHQNARGEFNQRVAACRSGVALLREEFPGITHLRDVQEMPWAEIEPLLPDSATPTSLEARGIELRDLPGLQPDTVLKVRMRCRHVWTENRRVLETMAALESGDVRAVGRLLDAAHASARDDYEVSCLELEALVAAAHEVEGVAGARLTGAGWGGCIVALVRDDVEEMFRRRVALSYREKTGRVCEIISCSAGSGAGVVGRVTA